MHHFGHQKSLVTLHVLQPLGVIINIYNIYVLEVQGPSGLQLLAGGPSGLLTLSFAHI